MRPQNAGTLRTLGGCQGRRWGTFDGVGREEHTAGARLLVTDPFRRQEPGGMLPGLQQGAASPTPPPSLQGALPGWGWSGGTLRLSAQLNRNAFLERGQHHTVPRAFFWVAAAAFSSFSHRFLARSLLWGCLMLACLHPAPGACRVPWVPPCVGAAQEGCQGGSWRPPR